MSLGIIHPPGVNGPFNKCNRLYFSEEFLGNAPMWCTVELPSELEAHAWLSTMPEFNDKEHHTALHVGYEAIRLEVSDFEGWFLWPRGTKITHAFPHCDTAIWYLTGRYFPLTTTTVYEGKWPD
jgi:hypothetical protein